MPIEFWDVTNREDWAISERSQQGISSRGYTPGPYSNRETPVVGVRSVHVSACKIDDRLRTRDQRVWSTRLTTIAPSP